MILIIRVKVKPKKDVRVEIVQKTLDAYSMQITPVTMGIVGGVLVALAALVVYVENRIKEPEEQKEEYQQQAEDDMYVREISAPGAKYDADKGFSPTLDPIQEGGKRTKRARKTKRTKRRKNK